MVITAKQLYYHCMIDTMEGSFLGPIHRKAKVQFYNRNHRSIHDKLLKLKSCKCKIKSEKATFEGLINCIGYNHKTGMIELELHQADWEIRAW